ncbi:LysR substrate-binding domain-containing protein [Variovorax sp. J31P179]|uniref:LysR substrate-binding domain-containing protein n=1 Tax=Variovorax sp. J31P179 TaxID=3053508 RepID=UPI002577E049|nr:LysR substrate-binding domain-containing protein [Variovorax sp. J31P179]MDM0083640.1 LysR substrate-binding domain-containing protein [Variovorax sp. J31P179]
MFKTSYVCIVSSGHPGIADKITMKQFQQARHAVVSPDGREHLLERWLKEKNIRRDVFIDVSHFMSLVAIVPGSELVATVPREIAEVIARHASVRIVDAPWKTPPIEVHQFWHRRFHKDQAVVWLRGVVHALLRH